MNNEPEKYVDCLGILEIRTYVDRDYDEYWEEPIDMFNHQEKCQRRNRSLGFDEYYCKKDYDTTVQKHFFCLVCDCEIKHVATLDAHVKGNKHIRKALQKKRQELGLPQEPPHQPQSKTQKKEPPRPRPQLMKIPLIERLREESAMGIPALGLSYINEWINPKHPDEPRRYTCVLEGCKSAWGDSEDMYRHLVGKSMLHNKNYLIYHLNQDHVKHYKKDELTEACVQCDKNERGMKLEKDRDYSQIKRNMDYEMYKELVNRPMDWSEKKEKHGIMPKNDFKKGAGKGANLEPLGQKRKSFGSKDNPNLVPLGDNPQKLGHSSAWSQEPEIENKVAFQKFEKLCRSIDSLIEKKPQTLEKTTETLEKPHRVAKYLTSLLKQKEFGYEFGYDLEKCITRSKRIRDDIRFIEEENMNKSRNVNISVKKEKGRSNSPNDGKSERIGRETSTHSPDSGYNGDNGFMQRSDQQIKSEYRTNGDLNHNQVSSPDATLRNFYDSIQIFVLKTLKNYRDAGKIPPEWVNDKTKSISTKIYEGEVTNWQQQGEPLHTIDLTSAMKENMIKYISNTIEQVNQRMLSRY